MNPLDYARIAIAVVVVLLFPAGFVTGCMHEKERFDEHLAADRATGEAQAVKNAAIKEADRARKEMADEENKHDLAVLRDTIGRLRRDRAESSIVPAAPAGSKCPDGQACFDRAELERAIRDYRSEIRGLVDEGSEVTLDLDTAKEWAKNAAPR